MDKKELRHSISRKRDELTLQERATYSSIIQHSVLNMESYQNAHTMTYFVSFRSEVDTIPLIRQGLVSGKRVLLPITNLEKRQLLFSELRDFEKELSMSTYGILEPKQEYIRPVSPEEIDFILTPGLVFDRWGYRIGYGGGFYDRFLSELKTPKPTVAVAYDLQVREEPLPHEPFDLPVDMIVTEKRIIDCRKMRSGEQNHKSLEENEKN